MGIPYYDYRCDEHGELTYECPEHRHDPTTCKHEHCAGRQAFYSGGVMDYKKSYTFCYDCGSTYNFETKIWKAKATPEGDNRSPNGN